MSYTREEIDNWLEANCGRGIPYGDATDTASMLHGLAYVLRQVESSRSYRPFIGQFNSATSSLRMALDLIAEIEMAKESSDETRN